MCTHGSGTLDTRGCEVDFLNKWERGSNRNGEEVILRIEVLWGAGDVDLVQSSMRTYVEKRERMH